MIDLQKLLEIVQAEAPKKKQFDKGLPVEPEDPADLPVEPDDDDPAPAIQLEKE